MPISIQDLINQSVVQVRTEEEHNASGSLGSAVVLGPDLLVTNFHVIESVINDSSPNITLIKNDQTWSASIVVSNQKHDLCLLKTSKNMGLLEASLAKASSVSLHEDVFLVGYPEGGFASQETKVILLNKGQKNEPPQMICSTTNKGGLSGGGIFNKEGELVGVVFHALGSMGLNIQWVHEILETKPGTRIYTDETNPQTEPDWEFLAKKDLQRAFEWVEKRPDSFFAHYMAMSVICTHALEDKCDKSKLTQVHKITENAISLCPEYEAQLLYTRGKIYDSFDFTDQALKDFSAVTTSTPPHYKDKPVGVISDAYTLAGIMLMKQGIGNNAFVFDSPKPNLQIKNAEKKLLQNAINNFFETLQMDTNRLGITRQGNIVAWLLRNFVILNQQEEGLKVVVEKVTQLYPDVRGWQILVNGVKEALGKKEKNQMLERAIIAHPEEYDFSSQLVLSYQKSGDDEKALKEQKRFNENKSPDSIFKYQI